jgi:hypothetical protein
MVALLGLGLSLGSGVVADAQPTQLSPSVVTGDTPQSVASGQATLQAQLDPDQDMRLTLVLQPPRSAELERLIADQQDPTSPRFHQFLTFDQWKARFAPSNADVRRVTAWARSAELTVRQTFRNNLAVQVVGTVAAVQNAFGVTMNRYAAGGQTFFSNDRDPHLPQALVGVVKDITGLNGAQIAQPASGPRPAAAARPESTIGSFSVESTLRRNGSSATAPHAAPALDGGAVEPPDLWSSEGYDLNGLQRLGHCCNPTHDPNGSPKEQSIAILGQNKPDRTDLNTFYGRYHLAAYVTDVEINGPACCDDEMTLDAEYATAFSNSFGSYLDTAHVYLYEGGGTLISDLLDSFQQAQSEDRARSASVSFGTYEDALGGLFKTSISDFTDVINAMIASGWTLAAASGDHGAYEDCKNYSVNFPASDPFIVAVGGTQLSLTADGGGVARYAGEQAWGGVGCGTLDYPGQALGGGGGGCSDTFGQPDFQGNASTGCPGHRAMPDVALNAVGQSFYYLGKWTVGGGTSIGAPEMAGFFAQENAYLGNLGNVCGTQNDSPCAPFGSANPIIWSARTRGAHNPFYDITAGCNGGYRTFGYCAGPGYDLATGWGDVNMMQLAWNITESAIGFHDGRPDADFAGSADHGRWYNTDQIVKFHLSSSILTNTNLPWGIAGYSAGWDDRVPDAIGQAHPGSGDGFYDGPRTLDSDSGTFHLADAGLGCHDLNVRAWDDAGLSNLSAYGPICFDNRAPDVSITAPTAASYSLGQQVAANYACADGDSGIASCTGPVANGLNIDTSSLGTKAFPVTATDVAGNTASSSVTYSIGYGVCLQYDPTASGPPPAFKFSVELCNAKNVNLSSKNITVTALAVDGDPAKAVSFAGANPGNVFWFGPYATDGSNAYRYWLDTEGLSKGAHTLTFSVSGDPVQHTISFAYCGDGGCS